MKTFDYLMMVLQVLGGLSLFIYGMNVLTTSIREAAGSSLRRILARATKSPLHGVALGMTVGFLAHSAAAVAMICGFINAGVMTLAQSIAPIFGANIGTALSTQVLSFNIGKYCWAVISLGFLVKSLVPSDRWRKGGMALIGFGMLFLGMATISGGVKPYAEQLKPLLGMLTNDTFGIRLAAVGVSILVTALLTSSGAMIGICFGLINAGVFTTLEQVAPFILGATIGTCIVPVMATLAMNIGARRGAWAHVLFNVLNVALALAVWPVLIWLCRTVAGGAGSSLTRQVANTHLFAMLLGTCVMLPLTRAFIWLVRKLTPSAEAEPTPSFLEDKLLAKPEQALQAVIRELHRMGDICVDSMVVNGKLMLGPSRELKRRLAANENTINEVRESMRDYLERLAHRTLSRRQSLFVQHLARCVKDLERIGDHLAHIGDISVERFAQDAAMVPEPLFKTWFLLFCSAKRVVALMVRSFDPDLPNFKETAAEILRARDIYTIQSMDAKADFVGAARNREITSVAGFYLSRYIENLDLLVRRAKSVAFAERQPDFWLKAARLDRESDELVDFTPQPRVDATEYLKILAKDNPLDDSDVTEVESQAVPAESPHQPGASVHNDAVTDEAPAVPPKSP